MALDVRHPDAERLAEYADGVLDAESRADVERHLADCSTCRAVVMDTMDFIDAGSRIVPFRRRRWVTGVAAGLAAAAALAVAIRVARPEWAGGLFGAGGDRPELQELIAAVANEPTRPVEGRLSGGFKYAPPPSPTRGPGDRDMSPDVRIAAARIESAAGARSDRSDPALGVAHLAVGDVDHAIEVLTRAAAAQPGNAAVQNDLAVALLTRASRTRARGDLEAARAAADRAAASDPTSAPAAFNRALILEWQGASDAGAAWTRAAALQEAGPWRAEAERHVAALGERTGR